MEDLKTILLTGLGLFAIWIGAIIFLIALFLIPALAVLGVWKILISIL